MEKNPRDIALKYLAGRDRTRHEVEKHLKENNFSKEEISDTLAFLQESKLLDDEDFCRRYIEYGIEKGRGPIRLERELSGKGIDDKILRTGIEEAFGSGKESKFALKSAQKISANKENISFGFSEGAEEETERPPEKDAAERAETEKELARIGRRLSNQGYHVNAILEVLRILKN